jgi:c-di-GMP-related signal transduction protein
LLGDPSPLRPVFQLMLAHESGNWNAAADLCDTLHLHPEDVAGLYWQAQEWARELTLAQ